MKKSLMALLVASAVSFAGTTSGDTTVNATAEQSCSITNSPSLNIDFTGFEDTTSSFNIDVVCSNGLSYTLSIDGGSNPNGELRRATDGNGNYITYRLFSDSGMTNEIGVTSGNTINGSGSGNVDSINIYSKVALADNNPLPPIGSYSDSINITLSW